MAKQIKKEFYKKARATYKSPIQLLHALYNTHCDTEFRIPSIGKFEGLMQIWLGNKGYKLMQGCLLIQNKFDKKFAQQI